MKRAVLSALVWSMVVAGCSDNEAALFEGGVPSATTNNGGTTNSGTTTNNSTTNNATTNNTTGTTNNQTTPNNGGTEPTAYDTDPGADTRDYTGTLPPNPGSGEVETFVYNMFVSYCERAIECRDNVEVLSQLQFYRLGSVGECVAEHLARNNPADYEAAVQAGVSQWFPDEATFCAQGIASASCELISDSFFAPRSQIQACQDALFGLNGEGDSCATNGQCGTGRYCEKGLTSDCTGTCLSNDPRGVFCGNSQCELSEYCDVDNGACVAKGAAGAACTDQRSCSTGTFCDYDGTCKATKLLMQEGQPCDVFSNLCAPGLGCTPQMDGLPTCQPYLGEGESCETANNCGQGLFCDGDNVCSAKVTVGVCSNPTICASSQCAMDSCRDPQTTCAIPTSN